MISCEEARALLPLSAGSDLASAEAEALAEHLDVCPACRADAAAWKRDLERAVSGLRQVKPPPLAAERLEGMIAAAAAELPRPSSPPRRRSSRRILAAAAVVACLALWPALRPPVGPGPTGALSVLQEIFQDCLVEPLPLDQLTAARGPGVVAILAEDADGRLVLADCLEAADLSRLAGYPWAVQRVRTWTAGRETAGLLVAICRTGGADRSDRRQLQRQVLTRLGENP